MVDRFRYLEKFVGTYRVLPQLDLLTNNFPRTENGSIDPSYEDMFIACTKGEIRHTYNDNYELVWCVFGKIGTGRNVERMIQSKYPKLDHVYEESGEDVLIWFHESDLKKIATLVKPKTAGAKIQPFSVKNFPSAAYKIPEADEAKYSALTKSLSKADKLKYGKLWPKEFDSEIIKKMGKKYKLDKIRDDSGLSNKAFIHSIGLWEDYLKFVKKRIKQID